MSPFSTTDYKILFKNDWQTTGLAQAIAALNRNDLCDEYRKLVHSAPHRSDSCKPYFVGHDGKHSANDSNRQEEIPGHGTLESPKPLGRDPATAGSVCSTTSSR